MSRQRSDAFEGGSVPGPLFEKPLGELFAPADPHTSVKAAAQLAASGGLGKGQRIAIYWVRVKPGSTAKELGAAAAAFYGQGDPEVWRQRIGRRLNELLEARLVHRRGERDGCSLWWPGPDPEGAR